MFQCIYPGNKQEKLGLVGVAGGVICMEKHNNNITLVTIVNTCTKFEYAIS